MKQASHPDLSLLIWGPLNLLSHVENALTFFKEYFLKIVDKNAPIGRFRVRGREKPWFSLQLSIHQGNVARAKTGKDDSPSDWSTFKHLRNKCISFIKKAKSEKYLHVTTKNLNKPTKLWKVIKSLSINRKPLALP